MLNLTGRDIHETYMEVAEERWKQQPRNRRLFLTSWDNLSDESRAIYDAMASRLNEQLAQASTLHEGVLDG